MTHARSASSGRGTGRGVVVLVGCTQHSIGEVFLATLAAGNEVPVCLSATATGDATISVVGGVAEYTINLFAASSTVTAAHLHAPALAGDTARAVATPFTGSVPPPVNGTLVQGVFTPADVSGMSWATLLSHVRNGRAYVNVHATNCPGGETRGQLAKQ